MDFIELVNLVDLFLFLGCIIFLRIDTLTNIYQVNIIPVLGSEGVVKIFAANLTNLNGYKLYLQIIEILLLSVWTKMEL